MQRVSAKMKINLSEIDREIFDVKEYQWEGETLYLVIPNELGIKWSRETVIFRSSLWNSCGLLVSGGLKKFTNFGENQEVFPLPKSLEDSYMPEKIDGSCLIISKYKGKFIKRIRAGIDLSGMVRNGHEIGPLMAKYPKILKLAAHKMDWNFSIILEWVSPLNRIVIEYPEPDLILTGLVWHDDYTLMPQDGLDQLAKDLGLNRPKYYYFETLSEMLAAVKEFKGVEGIVLYTNNGQTLHKIKGDLYCKLHFLKSKFCSVRNVIDLYMYLGGAMTYDQFYGYIAALEYELAEMTKGFVLNITNSKAAADKFVAEVTKFVEPLKGLPRKEVAQKVIQEYCDWSWCAFTLLDGRPLNPKQQEKLIYRFLKE